MNRPSPFTLAAALVGALAIGLGPSAAETPAAEAAAANPFDQGMHAVLTPYLQMQDRLAADSTEGLKPAAEAIIAAASKLDPQAAPAPHADHYAKLPARLTAGAEALRDAKDLTAARAAFKDLSKPMNMWATLSSPAGIDVVYCSMAQGGWLQKTGPIRNPYHGSEMLACGEVVAGAGAKKK